VQIITGGAATTPSGRRTATFSGDVWGDSVLPETDDVLINNVFFAPGARTYWHSHDRGQILIVTAGVGAVWDRDGRGGRIATGDVVFIPPGSEHWHGACSDRFMAHTAISLGGHEWLEKVAEDDYLAGAGPA
jgi:quercetin dioxygenase-like cupin family protein